MRNIEKALRYVAVPIAWATAEASCRIYNLNESIMVWGLVYCFCLSSFWGTVSLIYRKEEVVE